MIPFAKVAIEPGFVDVDVVIAVCAVLLMASLVGLILIHTPRKCPFCGRRNTEDMDNGNWLCFKCGSYFKG